MESVVRHKPTIDEVFQDDPLIKVLSRNDDEGLYKVLLGDIETIITIKLEFKDGWFRFFRDYNVSTPNQAGVYYGSRNAFASPALALAEALAGLTTFYEIAIDDGHQPNEKWLVG